MRVSTPDQKTDMQLYELREYAARRGYVVYEVYEDIISGITTKRPALKRLMNDAKKRRFDILLVWKFDRFARSLTMLVSSLELFKELGIDFISYQENLDTTTSMGKLIFSINAAYAEFEREVIGDRVRAGVRAKIAKTGKWGRDKLEYAKREKIREMTEAGRSVRAIALEMKISTRTVMKYKK